MSEKGCGAFEKKEDRMPGIRGRERIRVPDCRKPEEVQWGRIEIDAEVCTGCRLCVRSCAGRAIAVVEGKARFPDQRSEAVCIYCGDCAAICPSGAISLNAPYRIEKLYRIIDKGEPQLPRL